MSGLIFQLIVATLPFVLPVLELSSPNGRLSSIVNLQLGGRLQSIRVDNLELLVQDAAAPWDSGLYPMIPFAGRIDNGAFNFEGRQVQLPATNGSHAMHGYGFMRPWQQIDATTISYEFDDPWPWRGRAEQRFELTDTALTLHVTVNAIDRQPIQVGWHPWFVRDIGNSSPAVLDFKPCEMFVRDRNGIPTGETVAPTVGPWDDCFQGLLANPRISWGDVHIELSSSLDHWTVYDEPLHALCVEPQLGPPNSANTGPLVLEAGESITHSFRINFELLKDET